MNEPRTLQQIINDRADTEFMHKYMNDVHNFIQTANILFEGDVPPQMQSLIDSLESAHLEPEISQSMPKENYYKRKMRHRERFTRDLVNSIQLRNLVG